MTSRQPGRMSSGSVSCEPSAWTLPMFAADHRIKWDAVIGCDLRQRVPDGDDGGVVTHVPDWAPAGCHRCRSGLGW